MTRARTQGPRAWVPRRPLAYSHLWLCSDGAVTFLQIVAKVSYPSIMWGLGTAIGELPPYFIARAAKLAGEKLDELEVPDTDGDAAPTLFDK